MPDDAQLNRRSCISVVATSALAMITVLLLSWACLQVPKRPPNQPAVALAAEPKVEEHTRPSGIASCAVTGCHGAVKTRDKRPIWGNEYRVWLKRIGIRVPTRSSRVANQTASPSG